MLKQDLQFSYPEELVATEPQRPSRVLWYDHYPLEITLEELVERIAPGDLLIINETKVLKRRVFNPTGLEILFLKQTAPREWEVLFPSKAFKLGESIPIPGGHSMTLTKKGRPQTVTIDSDLTSEYFESNGEVPLPPYIQRARGQRHAQENDESWYQTFWARQAGSLAAPTASLHFNQAHFEKLKQRGVAIHPVTLHVGLGTFLPVTADNLDEHVMHFEEAEISGATWDAIQAAKSNGQKIWALGTTVARTLESAAVGKLPLVPGIGHRGETDLFIQPGYEWQVVDRLLTNFHQPESTLLALVAAFKDLQQVRAAYAWAIEKRYRLFSYGDLSVWIK